MEPRIRTLTEKKLAGKHMHMSLADNKTHLLWKSFMPERRKITNAVGTDLYSVQVHEQAGSGFDPMADFEKWAAVEVSSFENIPEGMETFLLPVGLYAVFLHKGAASEGERTFRYIFETWLPGSGYVIDSRPHFEVLGEKYKNDDPGSEEEVWIPVKQKD